MNTNYAKNMADSDKSATCLGYPGMERWKGTIAIVTGASAGIGYETAKRLAQLGVVVVGCARNITTIETLSQELSPTGGKLVAMKCDVSKEEDILSMMSAIKSQFGGADICINNAGLGYDEPLLTGDTEKWRHVLEVNVLGLCVMTREFIKQLRERGVDDGHVVHISSISAHRVVGTFNHFYAATKFSIAALTEGLRKELRDLKSNIKVTAISPGLVATEFLPRVRKLENPKESIDELFSKFGYEVLTPEDIANSVIYTLSTPPRMQVHDILMRPTQQVL